MTEPTTQDRIAVLGMVARDYDENAIAAANRHLRTADIQDMVKSVEYLRREDITRLVGTLQRRLDQERLQATITTGPTEADVQGVKQRQHVQQYKREQAAVAAPPPARTPTMATMSTNKQPADPSRDTIRDLINRSVGSDDRKIASLAHKAKGIIADLRAVVAEYEAKAQARADVARLEAELAAAREKAGLKTKKAPGPTTAATGRDWAAIRAWAKANGHAVGDVGVVRRDIVEQYDAAHKGEKATA
jgi:hypothetical protein